MSRAIASAFGNRRGSERKVFIPFVTAGDPDLETTIRLVPELARCGSDIVELGIPFSDPVADGPTIQRSSERALRHGYALSDYLEAVRCIRGETAVPIVLFSYFNPILQYGVDALARNARDCGVDGVLVTDVTPEEAHGYCTSLETQGLDTIFLAAPTSSPTRIVEICRRSRGFVYVVSRAGVTGAQSALSDTIAPTIGRVRERTDLPVAVGFGISHPSQVRAVWTLADGAVVGSALVSLIEQEREKSELVARVGAFCRWLTQGQ